MLIIEIALGVVLGGLILKNLDSALGLLLVVAVAALSIGGIVVAGALTLNVASYAFNHLAEILGVVLAFILSIPFVLAVCLIGVSVEKLPLFCDYKPENRKSLSEIEAKSKFWQYVEFLQQRGILGILAVMFWIFMSFSTAFALLLVTSEAGFSQYAVLCFIVPTAIFIAMFATSLIRRNT